MKRICVKKATQFQSAATGPRIYVYSMRSVDPDPDPDPGGQKLSTKLEKR
jgi:hypothetical protein